MSSHHIIRENQEPALVIMNTDTVPHDRVLELLEWSPTVMVAESCLTTVLDWGIKVDVVIAPESKARELALSLLHQFPVRILSFQHEHEALPTALYFLIASKQKAVNVISGLQLPEFEKFDSLDISVFQNTLRWSFIRNGLYEKWLLSGSVLHILPAGDFIQTKTDGIVKINRPFGFWIGEELGSD
jgi:hypothetical protein